MYLLRMTSNKCRHAEENPDCASVPQAQRTNRNQAGLLAPGSVLLPRLPSFTVTRFPSGIWSKSSPVTVAGTAPDFRRLPYYPRSRADLVRAQRLRRFCTEGKGFSGYGRWRYLVAGLARALHAPKLRPFGDLPTMFDGKTKALI